MLTRAKRVERAYERDEAAFLVAAGRFVDQVAFYDEDLAVRARYDPIRAGIDAAGRAGAIADTAAEMGLAEGIHRFESYSSFRPFVAPTIARSRISVRPPPNARLDDRYELSPGATVRHYDADRARRTYHLEPRESTFDDAALETLDRAAELLASGDRRPNGRHRGARRTSESGVRGHHDGDGE